MKLYFTSSLKCPLTKHEVHKEIGNIVNNKGNNMELIGENSSSSDEVALHEIPENFLDLNSFRPDISIHIFEKAPYTTINISFCQQKEVRIVVKLVIIWLLIIQLAALVVFATKASIFPLFILAPLAFLILVMCLIVLGLYLSSFRILKFFSSKFNADNTGLKLHFCL